MLRLTGLPEEVLPQAVAAIRHWVDETGARAFWIGRTDDYERAFVAHRQTINPPPTEMIILYEARESDHARMVERELVRLFRRDTRYYRGRIRRLRAHRRAYQYVYLLLWD